MHTRALLAKDSRSAVLRQDAPWPPSPSSSPSPNTTPYPPYSNTQVVKHPLNEYKWQQLGVGALVFCLWYRSKAS